MKSRLTGCFEEIDADLLLVYPPPPPLGWMNMIKINVFLCPLSASNADICIDQQSVDIPVRYEIEPPPQPLFHNSLVLSN